MDASSLFAKNFNDVMYNELPEKVIDETKKQVLDFIGVAVGGYGQAGAKETRELALEWGGAEQATVFGCGARLPAPVAAQVNASMAHSLDYDDVHEAAVMHPGVITIPTALAMSEYKGGFSGKDFIQVVAVGGDMISRMGLATRPGDDIHQYGWHFTTLNGFMTSAAVASRVLELTEDQMINAIGIGYHQSCGNGQVVKDGALTKRLGPGFAVRGGITAALLAKRGVTGARNSLEGLQGYYKVYHGNQYSREILVGELGTRFESENISIKPYPSCRGTHPTADAALKLAREYGVTPENVESIEIWVGKGTRDLLAEPREFKVKPRNLVDSQFSLIWCCATAIVKRQVGLVHFTEEAIKDEATLALAEKITVTHDPKYDTGGLEPVRISARLKDGTIHTVEALTATGSPELPVNLEGCIDKFLGCIEYSSNPMPKANADAVIKTVKNLDRLSDVRELIDLLVW